MIGKSYVESATVHSKVIIMFMFILADIGET